PMVMPITFPFRSTSGPPSTDGILVTLSAALLVGPPLATHAFPHFIHSVFPQKVRPAPAPTGLMIAGGVLMYVTGW
ncbi:MAG: hypothetical protein ACRDP7_05440, partial [Trebonia sp.]